MVWATCGNVEPATYALLPIEKQRLIGLCEVIMRPYLPHAVTQPACLLCNRSIFGGSAANGVQWYSAANGVQWHSVANGVQWHRLVSAYRLCWSRESHTAVGLG